MLLYTLFDSKKIIENKFEKKDIKFFNNRKLMFVVYAILIFIAYLPYLLRYYPGLLTADSITQVAQGLGISDLSNHHPIFHTGIIAFFVNIGIKITGNINTGIALYTIFQMIIMSITFSGILVYLNKKKTPKTIQILVFIYYMIYPVNQLFSVIMWKDIMFAAIIPIFIIYIEKLIDNTEEFLNSKKNIALFIIITILVCFMRNNGIYVFFITMIIIAIVLRKYWKKIIPIFLASVMLFFGIKTIIFKILNVQGTEIGEALSIPLQQIARVVKNHKEELSQKQIEEINKFFKCENIGEKYIPTLSDPVKNEFNNEYFKEHKVDLIKIWFELMKKYFPDYVASFISNSYGYYYPEAKHWVANRFMEPNDLGIEQTKLIEGNIVTKWDSLIERREIPIISMFFSIGFCFWVMIAAMGYKIYTKEYKFIIIYIPIIALWLTCLASPVFCEFRYIYSMFTTIPIYVTLDFIKKKGKQ